MAIDSSGWLDWAERVPGHQEKTNSGINPVKGMFLHSAEGYETYLRSNPPLPRATGGDKSWPLTNLTSGHLLQHYSLNARCWHATAANQSYIGMEHEGKVPKEPSLSDAQIVTARRVINEVSAKYGWTPKRPTSATDVSHTLWEHNEVVRIGGTGSACPSGRIPWDKILVTEEDNNMMIPHNGRATWFDNRVLAPETRSMTVLSDLGLPADAKMVMLDVFLSTGEVIWYHGMGNLISYHMREFENHAQPICAIEDGRVKFVVPPGSVEFELVGCVGYFK